MRRYSAYRHRNTYTPRSMRRLQNNVKKNFILVIIGLAVVGFIMIAWVIPFLVGGLTYFNRYKTVEKEANFAEDISVAPPVLNIPFEATNTASIRVTGFAAKDAKVEIYVGNDLKDTIATQPDGKFEAAAVPLTDGLNAIYGKTVIGDKTSLPSKSIKISYSSEKPKLEITEPADNLEITGGDKKIKVAGKTDPDNSVSINGAFVIVNNEGNFSKEVSLNDGENTIIVEASNDFGSTEKIEKKVKYTPS